MQAPTISYLLETELEWLIYQLWSKNTARAPTFSFRLAETVILRQGNPQTWYFSSKEGYILKKNQQNVRLGKINKRFIQKNGMSLNCTDDMPVATTYAYRPQRNTDTGDERMALRIGYLAGKHLIRSMRVWTQVQEDRPQVVQMFQSPKLIKNSMMKVKWSLSTMQMTKIINKLPIFEQRYSLATRAVTAEDGEDCLYTDQVAMPNTGMVYERILTAIVEIHQHIKKNADIQLTAGTFYFKADDLEKPVLVFATQLKTDRPILVLNPNIDVALILQNPIMPVVPVLDQELALAAQTYNQLRQMRSPSKHEETKHIPTDAESTLPPIKGRGDSSSDINLTNQMINDPPAKTDQQQDESSYMNTHGRTSYQGPNSVARDLKAFYKEGQSQTLPPKRPLSGTRSSIGVDCCAFCDLVKGKKKLPYELTANQIIKLYDYYQKNPANLLLLPANSEKQQKFFEDLYSQLAFLKSEPSQADGLDSERGVRSSASVNSRGRNGGSNGVPMPLEKAFGINSFSKYQVLRNDMSFVYKMVKLCATCYDNIKLMLVHQTNEERRAQRSASKSKPNSRENSQSNPMITEKLSGANLHEHSPIRQGWMMQNSSEEENVDACIMERSADAISGVDSLSQSVPKGQDKNPSSAFAMFSKVQGGREVQAQENRNQFQSVESNEAVAKSDNLKGSSTKGHQNCEAVSLNIKHSRKSEFEVKDRAMKMNHKGSGYFQRQSDSLEVNKQILNFVNKGSESQPMLKNMVRSRPKPGSAKTRLSSSAAGSGSAFAFHEKKRLRDARRNLRKKKEQINAVLQQQHRIIMDPSAVTEVDGHSLVSPLAAHEHQGLYHKLERDSLQKAQNQIHRVAPKGIYTKIRPTSAHPNITEHRQGISESHSEYTQSHQLRSLQPPNEYALPTYTQQQNLVQQNSHSILTGMAPSQMQQQLPPAYPNIVEGRNQQFQGNPHLYTNLDACRVYLHSVSKSDMNMLLHQQAQQKSKLKQQQSLARLARRPNSGLPPKPRDKSNPKDPYNWKRPDLYPATKTKSRSPSQKRKIAAQSTNNAMVKARSQQNQQIVTHDTINMFNYSSNFSQHQQPTNLLVPQNQASEPLISGENQVSPQSNQNGLAASLMGIQDMQMRDIDQIAENADNLIQILQTIKQVKQKADAIKSEKAENQEQAEQPAAQPQAVQVPAKIHSQSPDEETKDVQEVKKIEQGDENVNDFWDSRHTHSPPMQQRRSMEVQPGQQEDFWGDNQEMRVPPPEESPNPTLTVKNETKNPVDFWDSVHRKSSNSQVSQAVSGAYQVKARTSVDSKPTSPKQSVTTVNKKAVSKGKRSIASKKIQNSDLLVDNDSMQMPMIDTDLHDSQKVYSQRQSQPGFGKEETPLPTTVQHTINPQFTNRTVSASQDLKSGKSQNTLQQSRVYGRIEEIQPSTDSIPEPLLPQKSGMKKMATETRQTLEQDKAVASGSKMREYDGTLDYSKGDDGGSLESEALPNKLVEKIENIVRCRVKEELKLSADKKAELKQQFTVYNDNTNLGASAVSSSMPEMLQSEAFDSAVRQKIPSKAQQQADDEIDLSRMEVPPLSPVILDANPNVAAQVYAVVDNRFLESSAEDMPQAMDDSYTHTFSSITKKPVESPDARASKFENTTQIKEESNMVQSPAPETTMNENSASPLANEVPTESLIAVPEGDSLEQSAEIVIQESNVVTQDQGFDVKPVQAESQVSLSEQLFTGSVVLERDQAEMASEDNNERELAEQMAMAATEQKTKMQSGLFEEKNAGTIDLTDDNTIDRPAVEDSRAAEEEDYTTFQQEPEISQTYEESKNDLVKTSTDAVTNPAQTKAVNFETEPQNIGQSRMNATPQMTETAKVSHQVLAEITATESRLKSSVAARPILTSDAYMTSDQPSYSQVFSQSMKSMKSGCFIDPDQMVIEGDPSFSPKKIHEFDKSGAFEEKSFDDDFY